MHYGVCCSSPQMAVAAAEAGFDFVEWPVAASLQPLAEESSFLEFRQQLAAMSLPCRAVNCLVPGSMPVVGSQRDMGELKQYLEIVFSRAAKAGVETVVFGSGKARSLPTGLSREAGERQLTAFCRELAAAAARHRLVAVLEPLNHKECNIMNSIRETAEMVIRIDQPSLRLLADSYHVAQDNDRIDDLIEFAPLIAHVHVATGANRRAPGAEPCPVLENFMAALVSGGYRGQVAIEAKISAPEIELAPALKWLRNAA